MMADVGSGEGYSVVGTVAAEEDKFISLLHLVPWRERQTKVQLDASGARAPALAVQARQDNKHPMLILPSIYKSKDLSRHALLPALQAAYQA